MKANQRHYAPICQLEEGFINDTRLSHALVKYSPKIHTFRFKVFPHPMDTSLLVAVPYRFYLALARTDRARPFRASITIIDAPAEVRNQIYYSAQYTKFLDTKHVYIE